MDKRIFKCFDCKHTWEVEFCISRPLECPECKSTNIHREDKVGRRPQRSRHGQRNSSYGRGYNRR